MSTTQHDPSRPNYEAWYGNDVEEYERLVRCLQQQIEDCFTTISRIQANAAVTGPLASNWRTLREGLRCWRWAIRRPSA